jgi:Slime mold cyclic AMP receptor
MALSKEALQTYQVLIHISSSLSILGSLAIIISFHTIKELRSSLNRLVYAMAIYDLIGSIGTVIAKLGYTNGDNTALCQFQAVFIHVGLLGGVYWSACVSAVLTPR